MSKLRVLDLFSGIGGFSLGLERTGGFETVAFCEVEEFPRRVLAYHWPEVPCFEDVRKLRAEDVGAVNVICGGYPCQPFSTAGRRQGAQDDRHLWPEFNRLVAELRPSWVIGENVAGHISMGLDSVLSDLEGQGYACRTFVIPACAVGAAHRRDRCWTIGQASSVEYATSNRTSRPPQGGQSPFIDEASGRLEQGWDNVADSYAKKRTRLPSGAPAKESVTPCSSQNDADTDSSGSPRQGRSKRQVHSAAPRDWQVRGTINDCRWPAEPDVGRMAHGVPNGVDRLKALGNAVVPQIPEMIGYAILEAVA